MGAKGHPAPPRPELIQIGLKLPIKNWSADSINVIVDIRTFPTDPSDKSDEARSPYG